MASQMTSQDAYHAAGSDWFADRYASVRLQANRWFAAFLGASLMIVLLILALITVLPLKTLIPVVVHQNTVTGETWVEHPTSRYVPANLQEAESDIVRYLVARESYNAADINQRFHQVLLLSNREVGKLYADAQSNSNKEAPVNLLGAQGQRTVHIEDVVFIDKAGSEEVRHFHQPAQNVAKVDFTTTTLTTPGSAPKVESWVATIAWQYNGLPASQADAWDNWNGFTVTTYRVDPRNLS